MTAWVHGDPLNYTNLNTKRPTWSKTYPFHDVKEYGATGDGVTDDTAAIQAALDSAAGTPTVNQLTRHSVFIPVGSYRFTQLVIKNGVALRGVSPGGYGSVDSGGQYGTELRQIAGTNTSGIVFVGNASSGTQYVSPIEISNLFLMGDPTASAGSGIDFITTGSTVCTISEQVHIFNVMIRGWKDHGINCQAGGLPLHIRDVGLLNNGGYGIRFIDTTGSKAQAVHFANVSGDANLLGLIYCEAQTSNNYGELLFTNIKSEKRVNADFGGTGQEDCLIFHNCVNVPVLINGLSHTSSVPDGAVYEAPGSAIKITGTNSLYVPQLLWNAVNVRVRA